MGLGCSEARGGLLRSRTCSCVSLGSSRQRARRALEKVREPWRCSWRGRGELTRQRAGCSRVAQIGQRPGGPPFGNSSVGGAMRFRGPGSEKRRSPGRSRKMRPSLGVHPWPGEGQRDAAAAAAAAAAAGPAPHGGPTPAQRVPEATSPGQRTGSAHIRIPSEMRGRKTALPTGLSFWRCTAPLKLTTRKPHEEPACAHLDTL
ncbi:unnamed protein product [Nyctereutes procyonoides]|uniref:(raccoon dog) hypothetical protein n=1 Tax=Nyctereutes procyonoides TaxID=34880 RepID=A0A811ZLD1_NYCPR|nr:unnamed protein product [Nyctereutes procyonoides]